MFTQLSFHISAAIVGAAEKAEVKTGLTTLAAPSYAGAQLSVASEIEKSQKVHVKPMPTREKPHASNTKNRHGNHGNIQQPQRRGQN